VVAATHGANKWLHAVVSGPTCGAAAKVSTGALAMATAASSTWIESIQHCNIVVALCIQLAATEGKHFASHEIC
jgi:hypothetical protein